MSSTTTLLVIRPPRYPSRDAVWTVNECTEERTAVEGTNWDRVYREFTFLGAFDTLHNALRAYPTAVVPSIVSIA